MNEAIDYTKARVQFGKPISKFQNTQFVLADMEVGCEAGKLLIYQAAEKKQNGERYTKEAALLLRTRKQDCDQGTAGTWRLWLHQ